MRLRRRPPRAIRFTRTLLRLTRAIRRKPTRIGTRLWMSPSILSSRASLPRTTAGPQPKARAPNQEKSGPTFFVQTGPPIELGGIPLAGTNENRFRQMMGGAAADFYYPPLPEVRQAGVGWPMILRGFARLLASSTPGAT